MGHRPFITPAGVVIVVLAIGVCIVAAVLSAKHRAKLLQKGSIIHREKGFWDYSETFTVKVVTLEAVYNRFQKVLPEKTGIVHELQPENNRIVFVFNGYDDSFKGTIKLVSSEDDVNTYRLLVNEYKTKGNNDPNETALNLLYTAVEKTFLGFDPNIKVKTEYVDRKTSRSFF